MGQEAQCRVRYQRRTIAGRALLETAEIRFHGDDFRLKIPFGQIESLKVVGGALRVRTADGLASFELGPAAAKWARMILEPKPVIDKLGVKAGLLVSVIGEGDPDLVRQSRARSATVVEGKPSPDSDLIFFFTESATKLSQLVKLRHSIRSNGAIWVVWPKGRRELKEDHVRGAGKAAGLVDVKVVSFSPERSALKLVIPVANR